MANEFKVGDRVAHVIHGNGEVRWMEPGVYERQYEVFLYSKGLINCTAEYLRHRNFLSKIAEEQEAKNPDPWEEFGQIPIGSKTVDQQFNEEFSKDCFKYGTGVMKDGKHVPHSEVFNPDRFQRNAYDQLVDTVTGLEADSDGLVKISSIRDSVREII